MKTKFLNLAFAASVLFFASCSNDDDNPTPVNEEEVITTLTVTLSPSGGTGNTITMTSKDLDGDGPGAPEITITGGNLAASTTYNGTVTVWNETVTPAENITTEVLEEADEHQFFFQTTNSIATTSYTDSDSNSNPIGQTFDLTTSTAATGNLTVTLIHEPNKTATGVASGDITNAGGETDIAVTFNVTVQ